MNTSIYCNILLTLLKQIILILFSSILFLLFVFSFHIPFLRTHILFAIVAARWIYFLCHCHWLLHLILIFTFISNISLFIFTFFPLQ
eukprot:UN10836